MGLTNLKRKQILYSIIAVAFVGGLFTAAYAGPMMIPTITLAGNQHTTGNAVIDGNLNVGDSMTVTTDSSIQGLTVANSFGFNGKGVAASATSPTGLTIGVFGQSFSSSGTGLRGDVINPSGETFGVFGRVTSPDGFGLFTPNNAKVEGSLMLDGSLNCDKCIDTADIATDAVGSAEIADNAVGSSAIVDGAVASPEIFDGSVTSADIADGTITSDDIADGTITAADIAGTSKLIFAKCQDPGRIIESESVEIIICSVPGATVNDQVVATHNSGATRALPLFAFVDTNDEVKIILHNPTQLTFVTLTIKISIIVFQV